MKQRQSGGLMNLKQYQSKASTALPAAPAIALSTQQQTAERRTLFQHILRVMFRKRLVDNH